MNRRLRYLLKSVTVSFFLFFCFSPDAFAAQASFAWDQSTDPAVIGYKVYYGTQSGNYQSVVDAGDQLSTTVDGLSASQTYYFAATAYSNSVESGFSQELVLNFITASASANGQITPGGTTSLLSGSSQAFSITPSAGYQVSDVTVDGSPVGALSSYTFDNVAGNHTISAVFVPITFSITASAGTGGAISPSGASVVTGGASQTYTITPNSGYSVSAVLVDGTSVGPVTGYTFSSVSANHTISAAFSPLPAYTISAATQGSGSISPSGTISVTFGTNQTFTITPNAYYQISNVYVDGKSIGAVTGYTFSGVEANHSIAAHFAPITHKISAIAQSGGSVHPSGTVIVHAGTNETFTIIPARYYRLLDVLVDGKSCGAVSSGILTGPVSSGVMGSEAVTYTFTEVAANHTIQPVFSRIPAPDADSGPDQYVKPGSMVTLDGANSTDSVSGIASWKWTQTSGPPVKLSCPSAGPQCTFTAPQISGGKVLAFNLVVTNEAGISSSSSCLVDVSATDTGPVANAGAGGTVYSNAIVTLDGSASSDPDGRIASFRWVQIQGPHVRIYNANTSHASFVAPDPGSIGASLVFRLVVTDNFGLITRDQTTINVIGLYNPPVADAGPDQTAPSAATVTLDGSGSYDPANWTDSYRWKQIGGVPVTLSDPTAISPTFTMPTETVDQNDELVFMLTVTDAQDQLSSTAKCAVTVQPD